eukprot:393335_1
MMSNKQQPIENVSLINEKQKKDIAEGTFIHAKTYFEEFVIICRYAVPIIFCNLCEYVPWWIGYGYIGHFQNNSTILLASVGLAWGYTNCIGLSITWGMTKGLDTLIPQTIGNNNDTHNDNIQKQRIAIYFQQSVAITYLILMPIILSMYYAGDIMIFIGQPKYLRTYINDYCRALIPLVISSLWFSLLLRVARNVNLNNHTMIISITSAIIAYPLNYLLITHLNYGYIATAVAVDICMITMAILTTLLLIYKGYYYLFIPTIQNVFNKNGIKQYLYLSIPTLVSSCGDWWISETIIILSGYVYNPSVAVAGSSIACLLDGIFAEINLGSSYPLSIRIGKYVGLSSIRLAKRSMFMGLVVCVIAVTISIAILLIFKNELPYIWISHSNETVGVLASNLMFFVCLRQLFFNAFNTLSCIYIGLGNQKYTATISTICNYCVGLPLCILILFYFDLKSNTLYGVYIIWGFNSLGYALSSIILSMMLCFGYVSWDNAVTESQSRLKQIIQHNYGSIQTEEKT